MKVTVKGYWIFSRFLDYESGIEIEVNEATLRETLSILASKLGGDFQDS